jgi:ribosomal-protein-alanine N-acetyltransferase
MTAPRLRLEDAPTAIRPTALDDVDEQLRLRRDNRAHTGPWDPARDDSFYTRAGQRLELELDQRAWAAGTAFAFAVLATDEDDRLIGRVALANVVRGPWQNATLGYWIDRRASRRGHATRAVRLAVGYAFENLGLHRVQPAIIPRNAASLRVAEKVGFRHEGRALRYLKINGVWEDHEIFALTAEDWPAVKARADARASSRSLRYRG